MEAWRRVRDVVGSHEARLYGRELPIGPADFCGKQCVLAVDAALVSGPRSGDLSGRAGELARAVEQRCLRARLSLACTVAPGGMCGERLVDVGEHRVDRRLGR